MAEREIRLPLPSRAGDRIELHDADGKLLDTVVHDGAWDKGLMELVWHWGGRIADPDDPAGGMVLIEAPSDAVELRRRVLEFLSLDDDAVDPVSNDRVLANLAYMWERGQGYHRLRIELASIMDTTDASPGGLTQRARELFDQVAVTVTAKQLDDLEGIVANPSSWVENVDLSYARRIAEAVVCAGWRPPLGWQPNIVEEYRKVTQGTEAGEQYPGVPLPDGSPAQTQEGEMGDG